MAPRIVTLTLNPALDLATAAESVRPGHKIRTAGERFDPGGGGINVARVVHELGGETAALLLAGGVTGRFLQELLGATGVEFVAIPIRGATRISVTVQERCSGSEYRFVPEGPEVSEPEWRGALDLLSQTPGAWVVASGSLPRGVPRDFYARAAALAAAQGRHFVLDTSGAALMQGVRHGVGVLKCSLGEFQSLIGRAVADRGEQEAAALALVRSGVARMLAVTLGHHGALLATPDGVQHMAAPEVPVVSAVGAGDSFLAGLTLGLASGLSAHEALALGTAAGAAAAASHGTANARRSDIEAAYARLRQSVIGSGGIDNEP